MKGASKLALLVVMVSAAIASGQSLPQNLTLLANEACNHCHNGDSPDRLDMSELTYDLSSVDNFRTWRHIFDRVHAGEMPPATEPRPPHAKLQRFLNTLESDLHAANLVDRAQHGRVPLRRLSAIEYRNTISDVLSLDAEVFADALPVEQTGGKFDTQASGQRFSSLHLQAYLAAADRIVDGAIRLDANPYRQHNFDLLGNEHLNSFHDRELRVGGNISRKLNDGVAIFRDVDYLLRSDLHGFRVKSKGAGRYQIKVVASAFQSDAPVTMKVVVKDVDGQSTLIKAVDLLPTEVTEVTVDAYLSRTKVFYVSMVEERHAAQILGDILDAGGARNYPGAGIAVQSIQVKGPLTESWPPRATRMLLPDVTFVEDPADATLRAQSLESEVDHVRRMLQNVAPRLLRRPVKSEELSAFVMLAETAIKNERELPDVVRIVLRALLTSPEFLFIAAPLGELDEYTLATRLSYFLWKTAPDKTLLSFAQQGRLADSKALAAQVDRLLDDEKFGRFVGDFCGQWLRLNELEATTPDEKLYPEYDEVLHWSVRQETQHFFAEVVRQNLSVATFIDSDFTFLNRRLAKHYGIVGVVGQDLRKVMLPQENLRGGLLTQASVLKVTANGFVTSPVTRGDFVVSDFMGTPSPPPPVDVGSIEPDTSGATTIREVLKKHRDVADCARCHDRLDPPGFALECFDPIGGFRTHYRIRFEELLSLVHYQDGPEVDASGVMTHGQPFGGVAEYKALLLMQERQLAKHLVELLIGYATGGEVQFADRAEVERILTVTEAGGFRLRSIIHEVVQSSLFRSL